MTSHRAPLGRRSGFLATLCAVTDTNVEKGIYWNGWLVDYVSVSMQQEERKEVW